MAQINTPNGKVKLVYRRSRTSTKVVVLTAVILSVVALTALCIAIGVTRANTEQLRHMEELKTGCMIAAAAELGCAASGMNAGMRNLAVQYAKDLGLAFQIRDDMLDVEGDAAVFGKPIGSDKEEEKFTFVDALGIEGCRAEVARLTEEAKSVVRHWADSDFLVTLADKLAGRVH